MRTAVVAIVGLLMVGAVAWFAAEQHYDNCVTKAKAVVGNPTPLTAEDVLRRTRGQPPTVLVERIDGCSRLPW